MSIRNQAILLFGVLLFCYVSVHQSPGWNQNSRLDLLHALFVHKTFKIDAYHQNTGDKSISQGHSYSDKPPGIVFLALPAFAVSAAVLDFFKIPIDSQRGWLISSWVTTAGSVSVVTALGGVAMFVFLCRLVGPRAAFLTTLAVFLGATPFPYATMLFSHAAVIGLIGIALWAIADEEFFAGMQREPLQADAARHSLESPQGFGVRQSSGALPDRRHDAKAAEDWPRSSRTSSPPAREADQV
jgi:hypothetical protein